MSSDKAPATSGRPHSASRRPARPASRSGLRAPAATTQAAGRTPPLQAPFAHPSAALAPAPPAANRPTTPSANPANDHTTATHRTRIHPSLMQRAPTPPEPRSQRIGGTSCRHPVDDRHNAAWGRDKQARTRPARDLRLGRWLLHKGGGLSGRVKAISGWRRTSSCVIGSRTVVAAEPAGVVAGGASGVVCDRCRWGDGSGGVLCRLSRGWAWSGGARSGDDGGAVALCLCGWGAVVAADRAALCGGRRHAGDLCQSGARPHDDRAVSSAPRGGAGRVVRRGVGVVRRGRVGQRGVARDRWHQAHANASQHANRDYEQLAREILEEADAVDAAEDERFGDVRGDELPPELATRQGRRGWLREAKRRLDDKRAEEARPIPCSRPERVRESKRRLEEEHRVEFKPTPITRPTARAG